MKRWLALLLLLPLGACGYNRIQTLDEQASSAQSTIEVQLQRRADLIPNLVSTVKGYAQHEEEVFIQVAQARSGLVNAIQTHDAEQMANANAQLTSTLGRLMVTVEAYPQLKADQSFIRLQDELTGTENRIAVARIETPVEQSLPGQAIGGAQRLDRRHARQPPAVPHRGGAAYQNLFGAVLQSTALPEKLRVNEALALFASFYPRRRDTADLVKRFLRADGACGAADIAREGIAQIEGEAR